MTTNPLEPIKATIFGKLRRGKPQVDWNALEKAFQNEFGGRMSQHSSDKGNFSFDYVDPNFESLISSAEAGRLDVLLRSHGLGVLVEILRDGECYYQRLVSPTLCSPKLRSVSTDELKQAIAQVDVLILTATDIERQAVHAALLPWNNNDCILQGTLNNRVYHLGMFGQYNVAQTSSTMGSLGRQGSTITSIKAIDDVKPKAIILVGIAFGISRSKQRLGDVIVADSIYPYELQRIGESASVQRGTEMQCGLVLSNRFRELRSDWVLAGSRRRVYVQQGLMLSGEKLVDNKAFRDNLRAEFPTALGGEMEGAGAYAAASESKVEMILVKSICDWADGHKNDGAQSFAAFAAVSLIKHILGKQDVLYELLSTRVSHQPAKMDVQNEVVEVELWNTIRQIAPQLYETGPMERNVWQRSGGDLSRISVYGDGRTAWDTAIRTIQKGGGGTTLSRLITTMREDYPSNESLQKISDALS